MSLPSLDLLVVLSAVLSERSVARAARRLHVTPSAVSNALARLRVELADPLVTRKGRGIVPTPRAAELAPILAQALAQLEGALVQAPFDALNCTRRFSLAMGDSVQVALLPKIATALARAMPNSRLRVVGIESLLSFGDLASSEVDLQIGMRATGPGLHSRPLFSESLRLMARRDHPCGAGRLSRHALASLQHVAVEMVPGRGFRDPVSLAYSRAHLQRLVAITVPTFAAAAAIAASTDYVATLPMSLLEPYGARLGLYSVSGPVPKHSVMLAFSWHQRTHTDPAMIAFRALVREACSTASETNEP